jgi:hypothetical protein
MATTTNYGWTTPDDTDLVKDGAAAIRTLGSSIDTSFVADEGDLLVGGTSDIFEALPIGAAGTVLTSDGDTAEWVAPAAGGGLTLISTATPSAATTVSFTSIPTTFKILLVKYNARQSVSGERFAVRLNNNSEAAAYFFTGAVITGSNTCVATTSNGSSFGANLSIAPIPDCSDVDENEQAMGEFFIYDADLVSNRHQVSWQSSGIQARAMVSAQGFIKTEAAAAAINRIDFIRGGAQTITGTFYLYGWS